MEVKTVRVRGQPVSARHVWPNGPSQWAVVRSLSSAQCLLDLESVQTQGGLIYLTSPSAISTSLAHRPKLCSDEESRPGCCVVYELISLEDLNHSLDYQTCSPSSQLFPSFRLLVEVDPPTSLGVFYRVNPLRLGSHNHPQLPLFFHYVIEFAALVHSLDNLALSNLYARILQGRIRPWNL